MRPVLRPGLRSGACEEAASVEHETSGDRARRAASMYMTMNDQVLRKTAREHGVSPSLVQYYVDKWRNTGIEEYLRRKSEGDASSVVSTAPSILCDSPRVQITPGKPWSVPDDWHLFSKHSRAKWVARQGAAMLQLPGESFGTVLGKINTLHSENPSIPHISRGTLYNYAHDPERKP